MYNSIGYLPEEHQAYEKVWMLISISVIFVIVGTFVEAFAFILYNENFHPFSNIIDGKKLLLSKFGYFTPKGAPQSFRKYSPNENKRVKQEENGIVFYSLDSNSVKTELTDM